MLLQWTLHIFLHIFLLTHPSVRYSKLRLDCFYELLDDVHSKTCLAGACIGTQYIPRRQMAREVRCPCVEHSSKLSSGRRELMTTIDLLLFPILNMAKLGRFQYVGTYYLSLSCWLVVFYRYLPA